jgi:hypothetical protein
MRVFGPIVDCPVETVRLDVLFARAYTRSNGRRGILDAESCLIGTQTAQPIRIRIGPGQCHCQRRGLTRHTFRRFDELVEVALVGARPIHHPSGAIVDLCEMF